MGQDLSWYEQRFPLIYGLLTTRLRFFLIWLALLFVVTGYGQYARLLAESEGLFTKQGPMIGGDFVVFRTAALVAGTSEMTTIYSLEKFAAMLRAAYPGHGSMNVGWLYPPTMYLLVKPLSFAPFLGAFALWVAVFGALFVGTIRSLWSNGTAMFFAVASPAVLQGIITGQTGLLTASLIALSAAYSDTRPLIAGIAAGVLTVKPQLGLLIPIAFVARGSWRAFAVAAATAVLLAAASVAVFGSEPWRAFVESTSAHTARMGGVAHFPFAKLITPFGAARVLGSSSAIATALQVIASVALAVYVFLVWRRVDAIDLRLMALATASPMATPYAFYYEMAIFVPPMLLLARRASETGWLRGERLSLVGLWIAALWPPGPEAVPAFPVSFAVALGAFAIAARRTLPAAGLARFTR